MSTPSPSFSYRLLSVVMFFLWVLHAAWLALRNKQPDYLYQRLGFYPEATNNKTIWIHAASVGEIAMIKPLVEHLNKRHDILVTTFTATGFQQAICTLPASVSVRALPIDLLPISHHFIHHFNIKLALIAETELWPETLYHIAKKGIPLIQINARLSAKSIHTSGWIKNILKTTLRYFDHYLTRTEQDVSNLIAMGADQDKITITGNLKHTHTPDATHYPKHIDRPYILFASTHHPEEELFAKLIKQINLNKLAIIAPRHPERAGEILKVLKPLGLSIKQRSKAEAITEDTQIYLADTLGELTAFMKHAELVIMGGSFNKTGGHNILEPARLAKAIITGPSDNNIRQDISLLLQNNAIIQVNDIQQLAEKITFLMDNPNEIKVLSRHAKEAMQTQDHILQDYLNKIETYL